MKVILKETFNGIEDCLLIDSDNNKKILEITNGNLYNKAVYIVKRRYDEFVESEVDKEEEVEL